MLPTFVIFLREALEASLILSIVFAALRQFGRAQQMRAVWIGVGAAIIGSAVGAVAIYFTVREYEGTTFAMIFEAFSFLVAVVVLTSVTLWVQRHSRTIKRELTTQVQSAGSGFALGLLAFTSVGRESIETALFTLALAFQTDGVMLLLGGALGVLAAVALGILIYRLGYHLDYRIFFRVLGVLLIIFAAGLLGNAVHEFQELGWLPFATQELWNTSAWLSQESAVGGLLHGLVGYSDEPTLLQVVAYVTYMVIFGVIFWRATRAPRTGTAAPATPADATPASVSDSAAG